MEYLFLFVVLMLARVLPIHCDIKQVYEQIPDLKNLDTTDLPTETRPASNIGECCRFCFEDTSCVLARFYDSKCSLFKSSSLDMSQDSPGAVYFKKFTPVEKMSDKPNVPIDKTPNHFTLARSKHQPAGSSKQEEVLLKIVSRKSSFDLMQLAPVHLDVQEYTEHE